jgi:hypothetical protein
MLIRSRHYPAVVWLMPLAVLSQIGLALFGIPLVIHALLGIVVGGLALFVNRLVLATNASQSQRVLAIALVGLLALQPCLIALKAILPLLAAVHEVNAFVILGVSCALALDVEEITPEVPVRSGVTDLDR